MPAKHVFSYLYVYLETWRVLTKHQTLKFLYPGIQKVSNWFFLNVVYMQGMCFDKYHEGL